MMHSPLVSVIVPVYKAEKCIHRCLDSLLLQTFHNYEILLVDDGSPDRSGEICDEYAAKEARIKVFHKENGGVSSARQCGLDNAQGEYIIHTDPDDWLEPYMLEELYKKAKSEDADIVGCDYFNEYYDHKEYVAQVYDTDKATMMNNLFINRNMSHSLWSHLVKRELYLLNNISFIKGINLGEDLVVMIKLHFYADKCTSVSKPLYHYYCHSSSMVNSMSRQNIIEIKNAIREIDNFLKQNECFLKYKTSFLGMCFMHKRSLVTNKHIRDYKQWKIFYPESNNVWRLPFGYKTKFIWTFAQIGMPGITFFIINSGNKILNKCMKFFEHFI